MRIPPNTQSEAPVVPVFSSSFRGQRDMGNQSQFGGVLFVDAPGKYTAIRYVWRVSVVKVAVQVAVQVAGNGPVAWGYALAGTLRTARW
jgi:hypothetical protein